MPWQATQSVDQREPFISDVQRGRIPALPFSAHGLMDQRKAEDRDDLLGSTTPARTHAIEVTGPITMTPFVATSAKDTDWTATLADVPLNGYAQSIQDDITRARYRNAVGTAATLLEPGRILWVHD